MATVQGVRGSWLGIDNEKSHRRCGLLSALYAVDAHWFGGIYFTAIKSMIIQIRHSF